MAAEKTVAVSFRVTAEFKWLLELAAAQDQRSQTNLLERLLYEHCKKQGITVPQRAEAAVSSSQGD
ncbi:MAG: hypothetical protein RET84_02585 [Pseudomonadota bacterium]|nr:hypothetical protein [Pseudomonadota bacterium]